MASELDPLAHIPWASGPAEILNHGLELLELPDTDARRRLALVAVDNAVEVAMHTFIGLPESAYGLEMSRKEREDATSGFPKMLSTLSDRYPAALDGLVVAPIEWYHRLRNTLYHEGNGITVELAKVQAYATIAQQLFNNLFGVSLPRVAVLGNVAAPAIDNVPTRLLAIAAELQREALVLASRLGLGVRRTTSAEDVAVLVGDPVLTGLAPALNRLESAASSVLRGEAAPVDIDLEAAEQLSRAFLGRSKEIQRLQGLSTFERPATQADGLWQIIAELEAATFAVWERLSGPDAVDPRTSFGAVVAELTPLVNERSARVLQRAVAVRNEIAHQRPPSTSDPSRRLREARAVLRDLCSDLGIPYPASR